MSKAKTAKASTKKAIKPTEVAAPKDFTKHVVSIVEKSNQSIEKKLKAFVKELQVLKAEQKKLIALNKTPKAKISVPTTKKPSKKAASITAKTSIPKAPATKKATKTKISSKGRKHLSLVKNSG